VAQKVAQVGLDINSSDNAEFLASAVEVFPIISEIRILKVLVLLVLIVTNEVQAPSMPN
jgi:hypothetical protein